MDLTNKRALITGGTKGIGAAVAIDLARQGCNIAINGRHNDADAAHVQSVIKSIGRKCTFVPADIALPAEAERLVHQSAAALGGIDVLVHSAGGASLGSIDECSPEQW